MEQTRPHDIQLTFEAGSINTIITGGTFEGPVYTSPQAIATDDNHETETTGETELTTVDEENNIAGRLAAVFYGDMEEAKKFLKTIAVMPQKEIPDVVNRLVSEKIISNRSHKHDLWKILHDEGIYLRTESNWNMYVR